MELTSADYMILGWVLLWCGVAYNIPGVVDYLAKRAAKAPNLYHTGRTATLIAALLVARCIVLGILVATGAGIIAKWSAFNGLASLNQVMQIVMMVGMAAGIGFGIYYFTPKGRESIAAQLGRARAEAR